MDRRDHLADLTRSHLPAPAPKCHRQLDDLDFYGSRVLCTGFDNLIAGQSSSGTCLRTLWHGRSGESGLGPRLGLCLLAARVWLVHQPLVQWWIDRLGETCCSGIVRNHLVLANENITDTSKT